MTMALVCHLRASAQDVLIHTVNQMNTASECVNSHAGQERWSSLQPMYRYIRTIPNKELLKAVPEGSDNQEYVSYSRIKKMADGRYFLSYMSGSHGGWIFAMTSDDLVHWSEPVTLLSPHMVEFNGKEFLRLYVNMDAAVLPNGDLLAVFMYWSRAQYKTGENSGLMVMRSKDNAKTWSEPQIIYEGPCWEPYMLVLPDGRLQCYFTDSTPQTWNSGTSLLVSSDNGVSWSPKKRVCRSYKYEYDGPAEGFEKSIYTDQMPCFRVLNDGKTLVGIVEDRLATPLANSGKTYHKLSIVYNDGFEWKDLGEDSEGPSSRHTNIVRGTAGYVETFPSGEVVFSGGREAGGWQVLVADNQGNRFSRVNWLSRWYRPFNNGGGWGAIERVSDHTLACTSAAKVKGLNIGLLYLNHRIDACMQQIAVDGFSSEWTNDDVLYICAKDGCETILRAARDNENLYLLLETRSGDDQSATCSVFLAGETQTDPVSFTVNSRGIICPQGKGISSIVKQGRCEDSIGGFAAEIAIPLKELGSPEVGDYVRVYMEAEGEYFVNSDVNNLDTWQRILIK